MSSIFSFGSKPTGGSGFNSGTKPTGSSVLGSRFSFGAKPTGGSVLDSGAKPAGSSGFSSGFSFGQKAANSEPEVEIPEELKGKKVGEVLKMLEDRLEKQVKAFETRANRIARWDRSIFECLLLLEHLETQIKAVEDAQRELAQSAQGLVTEQTDFLRKLSTRKNSQLSRSGNQSANVYRSARELGEQYMEMERKLKELVERTDGRKQDEAAQTELEKIARIGNYHLESLKWISAQRDGIERRLKMLEERMASS